MSGRSAAPALERAGSTTIHVDIPPLPGLTDEEVGALERAMVALGLHLGGAEPDVDDVLASLGDDAVLDAFATEVVASALVSPADLGRFTEELACAAAGPHAGVELLRARLAEWRGQALTGERFVRAGLACAPACGPLVADAAWFASDRSGGDAGTIVARLHRKAMAFAARPPQHQTLLAAAAAVAGVDATPATVDDLAAAAAGALVANLVLFEGGVLTRFAADRGRVLPIEEVRLARQWSVCRHAVLLTANDGRLCDLATGQVTTEPVPGLRVGDEVVGVVVPAGDDRWEVLPGWAPIPRGAIPDRRVLDAVVIGDAVRAAAR